MAYDKVVDSAALDAIFTGIANAIRAEKGTTDTYTKDTMAAGVSSIADNAKNSLTTWLTNNGVTVPDGTLLDGLVGLLGDVEVGGSGGLEGILSGTIIPSDYVSEIQLTNAAGTPKLVCFYSSPKSVQNSSTIIYGGIQWNTLPSAVNYLFRGASNNSVSINYAGFLFSDGILNVNPNSTGQYLLSGLEYSWIIVY